MKPVITALILIIWIVLYIILNFLGSWILDSTRNAYIKRGYRANILYEEKKKNYKFYLTTFFLLIPILVAISFIVK